MKRLSSIPPFLRNKYVLTGSAFILWMLFFDRNDLLIQRERHHDLQALRESKSRNTQQIKEERSFLEDLKNDPATIEKFAREKYLMKRDNEDLFLIEAKKDK